MTATTHRARAATTARRRLTTAHVWVGVLLRALLPVSWTGVLVSSRCWIARRRPGRWETAIENMRYVAGDDVPAAELETLAWAHMINASWRRETRWRPGLINRQEVHGLEHLQAALAQGRGCLISFLHHGDYTGAIPSLARAGQPISALATSDMFDPDALVWLRTHTRAVTSVPGAEILDVAGGSALVRDLLLQGKALTIAIDLPGHTPTRFLGRDLMFSSGGIRVAKDLDVPVVAMTSQRPDKPGLAGSVVLSAPLQPRDFASAEELHAGVARQLETAVLAWPEAMENRVGLSSGGNAVVLRTDRSVLEVATSDPVALTH